MFAFPLVFGGSMQNSDYLMHYGVLGMKWGVRRYQNKDGTRTSLGKRHERKLAKEEKKSYNVSAKQVKKNMNNMTDQELRTALNRLNMQREVKNLNPTVIEKGKQQLKQYTALVGSITAAVIVTRKLFPVD